MSIAVARGVGTCLLCFVVFLAAPASARPVDNTLYAGLLQSYVHDGEVDYAGFKKEEDRLDAYLDLLAKIDPDMLDRNEAEAFYINAYNAWTIKLILNNYPGIESIKDAGSLFSSPWKKKFVNLDGMKVSLDWIEHDVLRPTYKDPRIHFAVNCASKSCPPLINAPYVGAKINEQLSQVTRAFINDPKSTYLEGNTLYVTKIMDWYGGDFGGKKGIVPFVKKYADPAFLKKLNELGSNIKVEFLDYDWSLNGK